ncbi:MAG TPA: tRNA (guanosine(37)-N1)-methyltransferase TrmD [Patescibacteria group bacterium]|nr:tRNA (guanosine(37)-N1)-methyltransferase TrmD [Patescibacteria group bacterium]
MKIDILTLFPDMFTGPFGTSMLKKAQDDGFVEINIHNLRDWATDKHKTVDDHPYGGGAGMVIRVDIVDRALQNIKPKTKNQKTKTVLLSAKGELYTQQKALEYSKLDHLILIAGHYEGVDERVAQNLIDEEISIGEYVLTGGEIPTMVITDSVVRLIPGVLNPDSLLQESHSPISHSQPTTHPPLSSPTTYNQQPTTNVEYPQYTRPEDYNGWKVPVVLLSGNHKEIEKWRKEKSSHP